mmetsp:Transcript_31895/g.91930  ORF Transcript_31895/g.91930 Transcript_31895/m.91930 type:complete len:353 (+) Transcript_31895:2116-3174(+)
MCPHLRAGVGQDVRAFRRTDCPGAAVDLRLLDGRGDPRLGLRHVGLVVPVRERGRQRRHRRAVGAGVPQEDSAQVREPRGGQREPRPGGVEDGGRWRHRVPQEGRRRSVVARSGQAHLQGGFRDRERLLPDPRRGRAVQAGDAAARRRRGRGRQGRGGGGESAHRMLRDGRRLDAEPPRRAHGGRPGHVHGAGQPVHPAERSMGGPQPRPLRGLRHARALGHEDSLALAAVHAADVAGLHAPVAEHPAAGVLWRLPSGQGARLRLHGPGRRRDADAVGSADARRSEEEVGEAGAGVRGQRVVCLGQHRHKPPAGCRRRRGPDLERLVERLALPSRRGGGRQEPQDFVAACGG